MPAGSAGFFILWVRSNVTCKESAVALMKEAALGTSFASDLVLVSPEAIKEGHKTPKNLVSYTTKISLMADKSKYTKLDDIGFVGVRRRKRSAAAERCHRCKTGEILRQARTTSQIAAAGSATAKVVRYPDTTLQGLTMTH